LGFALIWRIYWFAGLGLIFAVAIAVIESFRGTRYEVGTPDDVFGGHGWRVCGNVSCDLEFASQEFAVAIFSPESRGGVGVGRDPMSDNPVSGNSGSNRDCFPLRR
jgi:hypothetical protein